MSKSQSKSEETKDVECGYFCWRGGVWQVFTSVKIYVLIYGLTGLIQFALGSYETAIITTLEKRFKIKSRTTGFIMSSWDIGSIIGLMLLVYVGGRNHKPHWIAIGTLLQAISCFLWYLPYHIYGPGPLNNSTKLGYKCDMSAMSDGVCTEGEESFLSALILLSANAVVGVGTCLYYTLGIAYLDDNSRKNKMPLLLASTMTIRMFGPTVGFLMGSQFLSIYEDPSVDPGIGPSDPRWIGAWWMGLIPLGLLSLLLTGLIWPFPKHLPRAFQRKTDSGQFDINNSGHSFKDFKALMSRIFTNKVLMFNSVSSTLYMFGVMGYWTFMPKYLETQFQLSASDANLITGTVGLICTALGTLSSGFFITKFKPKPNTLAFWNVLVETIDVIGHASFAFLGCPSSNLQGHWDNGSWNLTEECNSMCGCGPEIKYAPLCSQDGSKLFYSPCHAGCLSTSFNTSTKIYTDCSCSPGMSLVSGPCPVDCSLKFNIFVGVLCIMSFLSATGRAGNSIIQFRSVSENDKAVSIGFTETLMSMFAFIPAPIFYGALLDYCCLVWGRECEETGNCWLYDGQTVRYYINFISAGFLLLATLADVGVWLNSANLEIYDKEENKSQELQPLDSKLTKH